MEAKNHKVSQASKSITPEVIVSQLGHDLRNSVLVISVLINLFLIATLLVIVTSHYFDADLIAFIQGK